MCESLIPKSVASIRSNNYETILLNLKRISKKIHLQDISEFKSKLFDWSQQFKQVVWLDSNDYKRNYTSFDVSLAVDAHTSLEINYTNAFAELQNYRAKVDDYIFGYLGYDLKNDVEDLSSDNIDGLDFPDLYFFQPKKLFIIEGDELEILYLKELENEINSDFEAIYNFDKKLKSTPLIEPENNNAVKIHKRITKKEYVKQLDIVLDHIHRGDIYEVNFLSRILRRKC